MLLMMVSFLTAHGQAEHAVLKAVSYQQLEKHDPSQAYSLLS